MIPPERYPGSKILLKYMNYILIAAFLKIGNFLILQIGFTLILGVIQRGRLISKFSKLDFWFCEPKFLFTKLQFDSVAQNICFVDHAGIRLSFAT